MPARLERSYGPYRVIRRLGDGGMGTVLLAEDTRLGRVVALKTVRSDAVSTTKAREHLLLEARAAAALNHPNIAAVHDILDIEGDVVIVFEYVEGETLAARLARGRLPVQDALRIGEEVAAGLAVAHAHGVIHRDLKPTNVMLTAEGHAKILDFGIAKRHATDAEETRSVVPSPLDLHAGTPAYAAPEQWLGDPVGPQADVFALGVLLFEMLSGRRPFAAHSALALMQQVIEAPRMRVRELNPNVPCSVDELIDSALSPSPAQRPKSAHDVANILRSIEHDLPAAPVVTRPKRKRWDTVIGAVLLAAFAVFVWVLQTPKPVATTTASAVVAVLPFTNATGDADVDYLATGAADGLTTRLASMSGITVISRTAVLDAWRRSNDLVKIAREFGAAYLIEGSVRKQRDRLRLVVNVVQADRSIVWGDTVEGLSEDVLDLESRLATTVGKALSVRISAVEQPMLARSPTRNPDALRAYWRGRALLDRRDVKGNTDAALLAFDEAVRLDPTFAMAHAARGEALWSRYADTRDGRAAQDAIAAGTTALRLDANSAEVRYGLAVSLDGTGDRDAAVDELQHALVLRPNFEDARILLGSVLARQGKIEEGIAEFRKVIDARPTYAAPYYAMGVVLLEAGRYREAANALDRVLTVQPDNAVALHNSGVAYQALGEADRAITFYERALAIRPVAPAYTNLGVLHHYKGQYGKAIGAYKQAIALRPSAHVPHRNLGDAYTKMGRRKEARAAYEHAIELLRNDLDVNPRDPRLIATLALYLQKAGRGDQAMAPLTEALRLAPADFGVLRRSAEVHALAGRPDAALDALAAAIEHGLRKTDARLEDELESLRSLPRFKTLTEER